MIRILVVDDQPKVRQGLRMRLGLEPDFVIVGEASEGAEALGLVRTLRPDVVLMDVELPDMSGIAVTALIRATVPGCAVVILTIHDDVDTRERTGAAGAAGFVSKHDTAVALPAVVLTAAAVQPCGS